MTLPRLTVMRDRVSERGELVVLAYLLIVIVLTAAGIGLVILTPAWMAPVWLIGAGVLAGVSLVWLLPGR